MARRIKPPIERHICMGLSLSNESDQALTRFRRALEQEIGHAPGIQEIREKVRAIAYDAISQYIEYWERRANDG